MTWLSLGSDMGMQEAFESERLALQDKLDMQKTQAQRNRLGQFATPTALAVDILRLARQLVEPGVKIRFLDPAVGTGSFYSALLSAFPKKQIQWAKGFEVDEHYGKPAKALWRERGLEIRLDDFTATAPPAHDDEKANLIVCNPPYVRHHHFPPTEKSRLHKATLKASGVALNGLAGLYCYFMCLSHAWLARNGIALWLVPSEFMDVNYGVHVKRYLLEAVALERIHRFDPSEAQFEDAIVSSTVVCFRNRARPPGHAVQFTYGGTLREPCMRRDVSATALEPKRKWSRIPIEDSTAREEPITCLADLFTIRRGIATGANSFFILSLEKVEALGLPTEELTPILPSPRYLDADEIESDEHGFPRIERRLVLVNSRLPEHDIRQKHPRLWAYLNEGISQGISNRYLCNHREPWYSQEVRAPAPFLCTYMGRYKEDKKVFRFILNHSKAIAANVYLMLYPKPRLAHAVAGDKLKLRAVWEALRRIGTESLVNVGRVYGGGLHKVEPKELACASAETILEVVPEARFRQTTFLPV